MAVKRKRSPFRNREESLALRSILSVISDSSSVLGKKTSTRKPKEVFCIYFFRNSNLNGSHSAADWWETLTLLEKLS